MDREGILTPNFSSVFMSVVFIGSKTRCTSPRKSHVYQKRKAQLSSSNTWCFEVGLETRLKVQKALKISSKRFVTTYVASIKSFKLLKSLLLLLLFFHGSFQVKTLNWSCNPDLHTTMYCICILTCTKYLVTMTASIFVQHECRLLLLLLLCLTRTTATETAAFEATHESFLIVSSLIIFFSSAYVLNIWKENENENWWNDQI